MPDAVRCRANGCDRVILAQALDDERFPFFFLFSFSEMDDERFRVEKLAAPRWSTIAAVLRCVSRDH